MSEKESTHGLACPNCGGMVPIPEGQRIVHCPYCEMRSLVRGERGIQRYQVRPKLERPQTPPLLKKFLSSHRAIAGDAKQRFQLQEAFLVYLPFWTSWARLLAWVFGQKRVGSGDDAHYEPREVQVVQETTWNGAACDVGEFGVENVNIQGRPLEAFDADGLHRSGMVFEPVSSASDARQSAEDTFQDGVRRAAHLDRIAQVFTRLVRSRFGLVYYPLWVLRYLYRGRAFQVSVDAFSGEVLYGKAPGNTFYRAGMLVGGMALGAILAVDGSAISFAIAANSSGDSVFAFIVGGFIVLAAGFGVMLAAYRKFRYGEQFEYRKSGKPELAALFQPSEILSQVKDLDKWINRLS
jgi:DNA-directed RNA polymerase subunit RPC12/RpoP